MNAKPISLLMFSNSTVRGGVEEHILQLLRGLDRRLFRLHLACTPELAESLGREVPADVEVLQVTIDRVSDIGGGYKLARFMQGHRIQLLHSHQFRPSLFASPVGWLVRVPVIIETCHGREVWRKGLKANYFVDRCVARLVDRLIAVSEATARYLVEQKGIPAHKIVVIRSAVDLRRFHQDHRCPEGMKRALGFAESDPVLLVAGRLDPQKGHRVLIAAMPAVLQEFPQARLVCTSDGSLRPELERMVAEKKLGDAVRFVGYQADIRDWLSLADVAVLPSFYEGLPLAAIEALGMARPLVATAVDGTPEVVLQGKTGLLVPPGDPTRLADAICQMLRDPVRAREMAQAGRRFVLEAFSLDKLVADTQHLYLQAWEEHRVRQSQSGGAESRSREAYAAGAVGERPSCAADADGKTHQEIK